MVIDQLESGMDLSKILNVLRKRFGIDLRLHESTVDEVEQILEHYEGVKRTISLAESFNTTITHPEYAKAILICEACRLFLHEIAPARKGSKVRTKKMQKADRMKTEDINPELSIGSDFSDSGISFDGEDHTNDYHPDRNPVHPKSFKYDYEKRDTAVPINTEISPETAPLDTEKPFERVAKDDETGVVARYNVHRRLSPDDYHDDRDPRDITPEPESSNPMDALRSRTTSDGPVTITGLDSSLESGMKNDKPKFVGNGFRSSMRTKTNQRNIPSPTDLQTGNKKFYNGSVVEASLALAWINKINEKKYYNQILEAAQVVATERDKDIIHILNAVENHGHRYANSRNDEYTLAMVEALSMIGDINKRQSIMEARSTNDKQRKLFNKLLNKSGSFNLTESQRKRFAYAAHNALFKTDLVKHNIL